MHLDRRSTLRLSAAVGLSALATACTPAGDRSPASDRTPAATTAKLMFIRHGEEPSSTDGDVGVLPNGSADRRSLSVRGWTRAGALVGLFDPRDSRGNPTPVRPELDRPTTIFAPDPGQKDSRRSLETVTPLAATLNLTIDSRFATTQTAQVADAIRTTSGSVLVAWKHDVIDDIITHLTGGTPAPPPWPKSRFDLVYVLTRSGADWQFTQVPQLLLAGDREVG
jgi:hypothetical protein